MRTALEQMRATLRRDTDARLEANERSMESLRAMIAQTDSMLERVLENLEAQTQ